MSFFEGVQAGESIVNTGLSAYERAKEWKDKIRERADLKKEKAAALSTNENRYNDEQFLKAQEARLAAEKGSREDIHAGAENALLAAETASIKSGKGRYGAGGFKSGRDYSSVDRNNLIRSLSGLKSLGQTTPEQNDSLDELIKIEAEHSGGGARVKPAADVVTTPDHPAAAWLKSVLGIGNTAPHPAASPIDNWKSYDK